MNFATKIGDLKLLALKLNKIKSSQPSNILQVKQKINANVTIVRHILIMYIKNLTHCTTMLSKEVRNNRIKIIYSYLRLLKHEQISSIQYLINQYKFIYFDALHLDKHYICTYNDSLFRILNQLYYSKDIDKNCILKIFSYFENKHKFYDIIYIPKSQLCHWNLKSYKELHITNLAELITVDAFMIDDLYSKGDQLWLSVAKANFDELKHDLYLGINGGVKPSSCNVAQSFCSNLNQAYNEPLIGLNHIANTHEVVQILIRLMYLQDIFDVLNAKVSLPQKYQQLQSINFYIYYDVLKKTKHFIYTNLATSNRVLMEFKHSRHHWYKNKILNIGRLHYCNNDLKRNVGPFEIMTYIPVKMFHPIHDMYQTYKTIK